MVRILKENLVDLVLNKKARADSSVLDASTTTEQFANSCSKQKTVMQIYVQRALKGNQ